MSHLSEVISHLNSWCENKAIQLLLNGSSLVSGWKKQMCHICQFQDNFLKEISETSSKQNSTITVQNCIYDDSQLKSWHLSLPFLRKVDNDSVK